MNVAQNNGRDMLRASHSKKMTKKGRPMMAGERPFRPQV